MALDLPPNGPHEAADLLGPLSEAGAAVLAFIGAAVGALAWLFRLQSGNAALHARTGDLEDRMEVERARMGALELKVGEGYVSRLELNRLEDRLGRQMEELKADVRDAVRGAEARILAALGGKNLGGA